MFSVRRHSNLSLEVLSETENPEALLSLSVFVGYVHDFVFEDK